MIPKKSNEAIEDPVLNDETLILSEFISNFEKDLGNPTPISDIINNEEISNKNSSLNKITIKGSAINEDYSLLALFNISAKTYMKNLRFESSLQPQQDTTKIKISHIQETLPSKDKLLLLYPFSTDLKPIIYDGFRDYVSGLDKGTILDSALNAVDRINEASDNLQSEISELIENVSITLKNYLAYGENADSIYKDVTDSDLLSVEKNLSNLSSDFRKVKNGEIKKDIREYYYNEEFSNTMFSKDASNIIAAVSSLIYRIESVCDSGLNNFLMARPDLIDDKNINISYDSYVDAYKQIHLDEDLNILSINMNNLAESMTRIINYATMSDERMQELLTFECTEELTDNSYEIFNSNGNVVKGLHLNDNGYLRLKNSNTIVSLNDLFELMFGKTSSIPNFWTLNERFDTNDVKSSRKGLTVCLWLRLDSNNDNSSTSFIKFGGFNDQIDSIDFRNISVKYGNELKNTNWKESYPDMFKDSKSWGMLKMSFWRNGDNINYDFNTYVEISGEISAVNLLDSDDNSFSLLSSASFNDCYISIGDNFGNTDFRGSVKNLAFFEGALTDKECTDLYKLGVVDEYDLPSEYTNYDFDELIEDQRFYLGLVGIYDVTNINIVNCAMKYNGNSFYFDKSVEKE